MSTAEDRSPGPTQPARENGSPTVCGAMINANTGALCILHVDHAGMCEALRPLDITDVLATLEPGSPTDLCTLCSRELGPQAWKLVLPEVRLRWGLMTIGRCCAGELGRHLLKFPSGPAPDPSTTEDPGDWHPRAT